MYAPRRAATRRGSSSRRTGVCRAVSGGAGDYSGQGWLGPLGHGPRARPGGSGSLDHVRRGRRARCRPASGARGFHAPQALLPGGYSLRGPGGEGPASEDDGAGLRDGDRGPGTQYLQPGARRYPGLRGRDRGGGPLRRPAPALHGRTTVRRRPQEEGSGGRWYRISGRCRPRARPGMSARCGDLTPPCRGCRHRAGVHRAGGGGRRGVAHPARRTALERGGRLKRLEIVQIGIGHVGRKVAQIVLEERKRWREREGIEVSYRAVSDTSGALVGEEVLPQAIRLKEAGGKLSEFGVEPLEEVLLSDPAPGTMRAVVDVAVHGGTYDLDLLGVQNGSYLVLSNKGPLSGSMAQYEQLTGMLRERLWHEATVGAGMPIISTMHGLIEGGDEILEIQASPSGTLGFVMSAVEGGRRFSEAVKEAVALAYAEPDPRDDLSGLDVARKAIILARKMGRRIEPEEIPYTSLVPEGLEGVSLDEFMRRLPEHDEAFAQRLLAVEEHHMLRYLARIPKDGPVTVGLVDEPVESPFGPISGPENVFDFRTRRYSDVTLTIRGPGAGPERTASGVVFDLLDIAHTAVTDNGKDF